MAKGSKKGSEWERTISKTLSLWWTNWERDDVFWRVRASGGRATSRSQKGLSTKNQYGDIMAVDPIGQPLIDCCTLELKTGYSKELDFLSVIDTTGQKLTLIEKFMEQVYNSAKESNTYPILIIKRDYHCPIIGLDHALVLVLCDIEPLIEDLFAKSIVVRTAICNDYAVMDFVILDDAFFNTVEPEIFNEINKQEN